MGILKKLVLLSAFAVLLFGCGNSEDNQHLKQAKELAQDVIIVDGHIDVPYRLKHEWADVSKSTDGGDFDFPRAREGGLDAPFMSIYIPAEYQETGGGKALADSLIDMVESIANDNPDKFAIADSPAQIRENKQQGLISLPMGMENGAGIEGDLENISHFYDRGIRYITLAHSKDNRISDSSYDTTRDTHNGLSDFGTKVVKEMNRVGIMVDVSHITDEAINDVFDVSEAPVIASHSSCRFFTPEFERNMSDVLIKRLAENDGVIMINFGSTFLDSASANSSDRVREEIAQKMEEKGLEEGSKEAEEFQQQYFQDNFKFSTVEKVADHIDHVVNLVGIDYVGLGSDYDGVGPTLPIGLKDVSEYPNLFAELLSRGYSESDIQKIASGNVFRVWNNVIEVSQRLQNGSK